MSSLLSMFNVQDSLSKKLSLIVMLLAVPVFILSIGIFYLQSRYLIRQEAIERSNSILRTVVQRVSNYMGSIETSTNAHAWLLEENFTPDSLESISQRIVRLNPRILSCSVNVEPDMFPQFGHWFSVYTVHEDDTITTVRDTGYEYADKAWYKEPRSKGKACWVEPFKGHEEGTIDHNEAVASYCRPLYQRGEKVDGMAERRIMGVIATDFSFSQLAKSIMATERPYSDAYFVLLGGDGRYFIHPDTTRLFRRTIFTDADPRQNADLIALGHEMTDGKQGAMHINVNGRKLHVSYHPVPGTDWSLAMVCPDNEILVGYHRLGYVIVFLTIFGLLAMLWLSQKVVRQSIKPINQLLNYTKHIADGNYDEAIPPSTQHDDIGRLHNSFAAMQQALHSHIGEISQAAEAVRKHNEKRAHDIELAEESIRKKSVFIQNLSHQIRTPLNIIIGFADMLLTSIASRTEGGRDPLLEERLSDVTNMMKNNAIQLKRMVIMLFDSSSATGADELMAGRIDEVSCNEVAQESIDYTLGHYQRLNVKFETELPDSVHILTNHLYLMRTIRELLNNAAKFSDGQHIRLHVSQTNISVRFTIEDVGPGLPENSEELIYKPFLKIDDLSEGLGLGLPLCKRYALSLGGDLIYDTDYKDGCRFTVEMPK